MADSIDSVQYRVSIPDPKTHLIHVELSVQTSQENLELSLPAWIPGSYMIRDFARNIIEISATSAKKPISLEVLDKQTWRLMNPGDEVTIHYRVYAKDLSVRGAHVDDEHIYFNGTSVFLRVSGLEKATQEVELSRPQWRGAGSWKVATTLPPVKVDDQGYGRYQAPDYESLIDYPVEIADVDELSFDVKGVAHKMAITGRHVGDLDRIARDLTEVCAVQANTFGDKLPIEQYLFQVTLVDAGYGGLEHRDSTSLICSRGDLPRISVDEVSDGYRQFLGLCAHEYFHLWNVKRIRPAGLVGADLSEEAYTRQLWAFEGFTSYYDDLALARSGVIKPDSYLELLARNITRLARCPGRLRQSVSESSFFAWTKFYKQDENAANAIVSYYTKGALISLGLDAELRRRTQDRVDLNSLMRSLWTEYGATARPVPEGRIEQLASELAGEDMDRFFDDYVHGTVELPLADWLASLGVGIRMRPSAGAKDQGGVIEAQNPLPKPRNTLGAAFESDGGFVRLTRIVEGGPAQSAGLAAGDLLVAVDGLRINAEQLPTRIDEVQKAGSVQIHAFRHGALRLFEVTPCPGPADTCDLWLMDADDLSAEVARRRDSWLAPASVD